MCSASVYLGGSATSSIYQNGTYTAYVYTTGTGHLQIVPYGYCSFTIDNVSVVEQIAAVNATSAYFDGQVSAQEVTDRTEFPVCSDDEATSALLQVSGGADGLLDHKTLAGTAMATTITREVTLPGKWADLKAYADSVGCKIDSWTTSTQVVTLEDGTTESQRVITGVICQKGRSLNQTINYLIKYAKSETRKRKAAEARLSTVETSYTLQAQQITNIRKRLNAGGL